MERKLLWHFARARARCGGVLYRIEDRSRALVAAGNAEVLSVPNQSTEPVRPIAPLQLDVNEQIECAQTLASRFYTDPSILEIEKARIFRRTWQLVGTLDHACGEVNGLQADDRRSRDFFHRGGRRRADCGGARQGGHASRIQQCVPAPGWAYRVGQRVQECAAMRIPRLDLHSGWSIDRDAGRGGR